MLHSAYRSGKAQGMVIYRALTEFMKQNGKKIDMHVIRDGKKLFYEEVAPVEEEEAS
jgi:hypothetical protein